MPPASPTRQGIFAELKTVIRRGREVWRRVSRRRRRTFQFAASLMLIGAAANTLVMLWLGGLVDAMERKQSPDVFSRLPLVVSGLADELASVDVKWIAVAFLSSIAVAYLLREALQVVRRYLIENTCTQIEKETTVNLVDHLLHVDLSRLSADRVGALHGRIHRSVEGFVKFFKLSFMDFFPSLFLAGFALVGAAIKQPYVAAIMAAVIPVSLLITARQIQSQKGIRLNLLRKRENLDGTVVEQLGGIEYIRAANTLPIEIARVSKAAEERREMEFRHHFAMSLFDSAKALNEGFFYILTVGFSIYLAVTGEITIGAIVSFSGLYLGVMAPLREVHRILDDAHESSLRVGMLLEMMNEPEDDSFRLPTLRRPQLDGQAPVIAARDLVMDYRTADGKQRRALCGVSLDVRRGETIGVAGPSGSGKSSWLKVVMRLVHPTSGQVAIGGEPLEAVSREVIGETFGYVSQIPFVFAGTVAENIAYGSGDVTPEEIERAARLAYVHDEILAMPAGYQTMLAERGQNLSGGQRQRIALARIFLKNPPVLILDEATSALDNISERKIQQALAEARQDRTLIMVAHRLTTLKDADRILVFDGGRIVESGEYDDLLAQGGVFTELVHSANEGLAV